MFEIFLISE